MKLPISKRLLCCASLVMPQSRVADIGTDHGYLGIYLLRENIALHVVAADLRPMPLESARRNASQYGVRERMEFVLSDGLEKIDPSKVDTVVCAGMGGDLMVKILSACSWIRDARYRLILQPQSAGQTLRRWLCENGFDIETETIVHDGGFLYTVLAARHTGNVSHLTPGQQYASPQLLAGGSCLLPDYLHRIANALQITVDGLHNAVNPSAERVAYYEAALREILEMEKLYGNDS